MTNATLLDTIIAENGLKNDRALAKAVGLAAPFISLLRSGKRNIGATTIIQLHETFPISVRRIKELAGIPCLPKLTD